VGLGVIDTDVAASMLRRSTPEVMLRQLAGARPGSEFVTVGELTTWTLLRNWGRSRTASLDALLEQLVVLRYDWRVAGTWGQLQAYANFAAGRAR